MTVRTERSFDLRAPPDAVWSFIADPKNRAEAISVVSDYRIDDETGRTVTWEVALPIPFVGGTISVHTEDVVRRPPEYVEFVGRSAALEVRGIHELVETDDGTRLENRFVVESSVPGVERYFTRRLDGELENLHHALVDALSERSD